jgi:cholesterol oxidase
LVHQIEFDEKRDQFVVRAYELDIDTGAVVVEHVFRAESLYMAAGSVHTTALLVRSQALGHLPRLNELVGSYWGNNGDAFGIRQLGNDSSFNINPSQGGPASYGMFYQDAPSGPTTLMHVPVKWAPVIGTNNIIATLVMGIPNLGYGFFYYDNVTDSVVLDWPSNPRPDEEAYVAAQEAFFLLDIGKSAQRYFSLRT